MSKSKPGGVGGDRKLEGAREGDVGPRLLNQPVSAVSRPLAVGAPGHTYIVQSQHSQHHDVKNFAKLSTRPIAPAPPSQSVPTIVGRSVASATPNIPSIISSSNVLQLGSSAPGAPSVVPHGISASIPINMLRGQQPQQIQTFTSSFPQHLPRGTTTLTVPNSTAILRGPSANLQIPNPGLSATVNLPLARQPVLQAVKSSTTQAVRSPSPSVPQAQPQDLSSRTSFPLHGSIAPVSSGVQHPMQHITLNRMSTPIAQGDASLQQRTIPAQLPSTDGLQQRISVSLADGPGLHQRLSAADLRSTVSLQPPIPGKLNQPPKVITSQPLAQHMAMKSVNLAVSTPVMLNSINPSLATVTTTTMASSTPIPVASSSNLMSPSSISASSIQSSSLTAPLLSSTESTMARPPGGSIITMTSLPSSVQQQSNPTPGISHQDNRSTNHSGPNMGYNSNDPMWFQHFVFSQQQGSQTPLVSQSAANIVRPGASTFAFLPSQGQKLQVPTSNLAATHLAAHAMSVSSNVRYNTNMMVMDQLRQPHPLHSSFSPATTASVTEKLVNLASRATVASSIYTASVGVQSHMAGGGGSGLSATPVSNPSSSPRPSILRKRTSEATGVVIRKPNFNLNQEPRCHSPPRLEPTTNCVSSPKVSVKNYSPMSENSQSSTDTALSSNDATTPTQNHTEKVKADGEECLENGPATNTSQATVIPAASPAVSHTGSLSEASPRKRARKQLLHANEELKEAVSTNLFHTTNNEEIKDNVSSSDEDINNSREEAEKERLKERGEYTDDDGVRWVLEKPKPNYILITPDCINTKSKHNHFTRHSEVKPKDERRPTVNELSNQKGIPQKVNGWKLYFSASQLEELMDVEKDMETQFAEVQAVLSKAPNHKHLSDDITKIHEMSQANIQRCQLIQNQLTEARSSMIKTLDHKPRIQEIVNKHMSKRPIKKKERT